WFRTAPGASAWETWRPCCTNISVGIASAAIGSSSTFPRRGCSICAGTVVVRRAGVPACASVNSRTQGRRMRRLIPLGFVVVLYGCVGSEPSTPGAAETAPPADVEAARQARKQAMTSEVLGEIEQTTPFEFEFDVEDVTGRRISKRGFAGKVLIVDFWGT